MIDECAIFLGICNRNSLRREARLPLLDVRVTFEREVRQARWREHVARHHDAVRAKVLREARGTHGPDYPRSAGGQWAVRIRTRRVLQDSLPAGPFCDGGP